jgi:hypothetical protein
LLPAVSTLAHALNTHTQKCSRREIFKRQIFTQHRSPYAKEVAGGQGVRGGGGWWENITPRCAKTTGKPLPPLQTNPNQHSTHEELTDKGRRLSETERLCVPFSIDNLSLSLSVGTLCNLVKRLNGKKAKVYWVFKFLRTSDGKDSIHVKYVVVFRGGIANCSVVNQGLAALRTRFKICVT